MATRKSKPRQYKAVGLKASTVRRLIRSGLTIGQIAKQYDITRVTLYKRFGAEIKGLSKRGPRPAGK